MKKRSSSHQSKPRLLFLTPTFTGGSGIVIEELVKKLADRADILVLGLGPGRDIPGVKTLRIQYFMFDKIHSKFGSNVFFNALYQTPLWLMGAITIAALSVRFKPKFVISNGFTPLLLSMFITKILGIKSIVYYGSFLERVIKNPFLKFLFYQLNYFIDYAFVNSIGSAQDLGRIIKTEKIITIEHWTAMKPASKEKVVKIRKEYKAGKNFVILYVGKFSPEKSCSALIEIIKLLKNKGVIFWFIGTGELLSEIENLAANYRNVRYLGYMKDRNILAEYLTAADATFTYADVTYLGMPATESLACGTPIIVSGRPALLERVNTQARVDSKLVPKSVGWILNTHDLKEATRQLAKIIQAGQTTQHQRAVCRKYAMEKYSAKNLEPAIKLLIDSSN